MTSFGQELRRRTLRRVLDSDLHSGLYVCQRRQDVIENLRGWGSPLASASSAPGDEDVLPAVVVERLAAEPAVESLKRKPGDVEQPEPFILRGPPHRACGAVLENDVDPVSADRVPDQERDGFGLSRPAASHRDLMAEGEGVPAEYPP